MPVTLNFSPKQTHVLESSRRFPFEIRVLPIEADRSDAYALRYRAYLDAGYIEANSAEQYFDSADQLQSTILLAAYDKAVCVGIIRVCFSHLSQSINTIPCAPYYPALHDIKKIAPGTIAEVGRMAIEPTITNTSYRTTLFGSLVRAAFVAAQAAHASHIVVTTRADRAGFYTKMLGFQQRGEPALYPPGDIPIAMLVGTRDDAELKQRMQNRFFQITPAEVDSMHRAIRTALAEPKAA